MNILFSITYFHPYVSGLSICAKRIADGLVLAGHSVNVVAIRHDASLPEEEQIGGVSVTRSNTLFRVSKGFFSLSYVLDSFRAVRRADAVLCHLPQPESVVPALFARLMGKKVTILYHCELELAPGAINWIVQSLVDLSHLITLRLAHRVVAYTEDYAESSRLLPSFKSKLTEIRPPIPELEECKVLTEQVAKSIGEADIVIGVAARLAREKGIEHLIDSLPVLNSRFPGKIVKIAIAGPTDPVGEANYKRFIEKKVATHAGQIVFLGTIPSERMASFYRSIDILAVPSVNRTEAFGLVQIEAMRLGVPVVVSDLPGVRVPVRETGRGIVVPIGESKAIAHAIALLVDSSVNSREWDTENDRYDPPKAVAQYEEVLSS